MFLNRISLLKEEIDDYGQYPFTVPSIGTMDQLDLSNPITFFEGEKGRARCHWSGTLAGKCGFISEGGGVNNSYEVCAADWASGAFFRFPWMPKSVNG